jgi:hypothetical protein
MGGACRTFGERKEKHNILVWKSERRPEHRRGEDIKIDLKEIGCDGVAQILVKVQLSALETLE